VSRRLVILALEEGAEPEVDWEGDFAYWEILAALERATQLVEEMQFEAEVARDTGSEDE